MDRTPFPVRSLSGRTWRAYIADLLGAPAKAKAALIGCFILMAISPAGLSAMLPFVTASFAMRTGKPLSEAILLFVATPLLISPLILPIAGAWVDRWGAKRVAVPAAILYAASTACVPHSSGVPGLLGIVIVLSSVFGFMASLAVVFKVITGWFPRHRGIGFALIGVVSSLAGAVLSPVFQWVINGDGAPLASAAAANPSAFRGLGWDGAYTVVAIAIAILAIPTALFLLSEPKIELAASSAPSRRNAPGTSLREALKTRTWIFITLFLALAAAGPMTLRQNAVNFLGERGFDSATVAVSQSVLFIASIIGLFSGGMILDRASRPWVIVPILAAVPIGLVLAYVNHGVVPLLFVATALLGFATGAESALGPFLIARYFGQKSFAQLQGLTLAISTLALGLSPFLVSVVQSATGSYFVPFTVLTVLTGLAVLLAVFLPDYPTEWKHATELDELVLAADHP
jgi:MFS family permease